MAFLSQEQLNELHRQKNPPESVWDYKLIELIQAIKPDTFEIVKGLYNKTVKNHFDQLETYVNEWTLEKELNLVNARIEEIEDFLRSNGGLNYTYELTINELIEQHLTFAEALQKNSADMFDEVERDWFNDIFIPKLVIALKKIREKIKHNSPYWLITLALFLAEISLETDYTGEKKQLRFFSFYRMYIRVIRIHSNPKKYLHLYSKVLGEHPVLNKVVFLIVQDWYYRQLLKREWNRRKYEIEIGLELKKQNTNEQVELEKESAIISTSKQAILALNYIFRYLEVQENKSAKTRFTVALKNRAPKKREQDENDYKLWNNLGSGNYSVEEINEAKKYLQDLAIIEGQIKGEKMKAILDIVEKDIKQKEEKQKKAQNS